MKYIYILISFTLLQTSVLKAQSENKSLCGKVIYERILSFENKPESTKFTLLFAPRSSYFADNTEQQKEATTLTPTSNQDSDVSFDIKFNGVKSIISTDFVKDSIISQVSLFRDGAQKTYIVRETISKINWAIIPEYKIIGNLKAQKAIGVFRGRKYTAWFTNEIPVNFGPWKFNGLPGLILEISDDKNEVAFFAKSFNIPFDNCSKIFNDIKFDANSEKVTLPQYLKLESAEVDEVINTILSKLPRGAKFDVSSIKSNAIELDYKDIIKE
ncbi:GLPGLI family protein [Flavobacterium sp.]|uniref:GLPGLI family protein n=1 Tax=Flavobacterium sp. TaxID=239 RepID=UPI00260E435D|nr:GLPGLI family protein [Flavobacterium sp.]MDD3004388.1 GLPGLI family protein [Flavobacterium sp.]